MEDVLFDLTVGYEDVLLLGDFNENLLGMVNGQCTYCVNHTCTKCEFANAIGKLDLTSVGTIPSYYPIGKRPSLIDLCLVSRPEKVIFFNQLSHGLSKHDLIFGSYSCNKRTSDKRKRLVRNFLRIDMSDLGRDACSIGWNDVFNAIDVNGKIDVFNSKVISLLNAHAPLRPLLRMDSLNSTRPWFSDEIWRALLERDVAEFEYKNGRVTVDYYRRLRNVATNLIKKA